MDVVIAYYSRSGTTEGLANLIAEEIRFRGGDARTVRIQHQKKPGFLKAARLASKKIEVDLANPEGDFDLDSAETVIMGCPIWNGNLSPYVRSYLKRVSGIKDKPAGVFITCASPRTEGQKYVSDLVVLAKEHHMDVKGELIGTKKERLQFRSLVRDFVSKILDLPPPEIGADEGEDTGEEGNGDGE